MHVTFPHIQCSWLLFWLGFLGLPCLAGQAKSAQIKVYHDSALECISLSGPLYAALRVQTPKRGIYSFVKIRLDSLGYFHAHVDSPGQKTVVITPGSRSLIGSIRIDSPDSVALEKELPVKVPLFYDAGSIEACGKKIARFYAERGFPYAIVITNIRKSDHDAPDRPVEVVFVVQREHYAVFAPPLLQGKIKTNRSIIAHDVVVREGEPFDIRKIEETRQRLLSRPYIVNVTSGEPFIFADSAALHNRVGDTAPEYRVTVPLAIDDRAGMSLDGAVGFASPQQGETQLRGNLAVSFFNLFKSGESAALDYTGEQDYQKLTIGLSKPWILGYPLLVDCEGGMEIQSRDYGYVYGLLKGLYELKPLWQAGFELQGHETTTDTTGESWDYYGVQFDLFRISEPLRRDAWTREMSLSTGTGIADRAQRYTRTSIEFSSGAQIPLRSPLAFHGVLATKNLITNETELTPAEMYRVGGYASVRGYDDDEFPFRTVVYGQSELLWYFNEDGSVFIFMDGGFGYAQAISFTSAGRQDLLGYGVGIRIPSRLGTMTLEWGRNRDDRQSLGRVSLQVQNAFQNGAAH